MSYVPGVHRGGEGHFLRPVDLRIRNKNFRKSELSIFVPINWFAITLYLPVWDSNYTFSMWLLTSDIYGSWCSETVNTDN